MGFRHEQNPYDLEYAASSARKKAEKLGYDKTHAITNFIDFAEIMSPFLMSPTETFDRWLNMANSSYPAKTGEMRLIPDALPEVETPESAGS